MIEVHANFDVLKCRITTVTKVATTATTQELRRVLRAFFVFVVIPAFKEHNVSHPPQVEVGLEALEHPCA